MVVILAPGNGPVALSEETDEGAEFRVFEAGYEGEFCLINVCNYEYIY